MDPIKRPARYQEMTDPQARPRYTGVPTFFRASHTESLAETDIGMIGVPYDGGVTNRTGARHGPRAVRDQSSLLRRLHPHGVAPFDTARVRDLGDCWIEQPYTLEGALAEIAAFYTTIIAAKVVPLSVGGDHSISYPILKALGKDRPLGLVHIDAHCDTMGAYDDTKFHHGGPFRLAVLDGVLDPDRTIQIGIRGAANMFWEFSHASGMTVIYMEDFMRLGLDAVIEKAREVVGDQPIYVSVDVDGFDPVFAPGTGTPEAGGLSSREGLALLRGLQGLKIAGADVVEVAPQYDPTTNTSQLAAQILFEEFALMTLPESA